MSDTSLASSLNIITLVVVLVIAAGLFIYFMRKRSNRHPMDTPRGKAAEEMRREEAEEERREEGRSEL